MKLRMVFVLLLVAIAGASAYYYSQHTKSDNGLLGYVPADTLYYSGGDIATDVLRFSIQYQKDSHGPFQQQFMEALTQGIDGANEPMAKFFAYLLAQMQSSQSDAALAALDTLGLSVVDDYVLYGDGLIPVVKMKVLDITLIESFINDGVEQSGWQYRQEALGEHTLKVWPLDEEETTALGLLIAGDIVTVSLFATQDDVATKRARFGLDKPQTSMLDTQEIAQLRKTHGYQNHPLFFFHLERFASVFSDLANSPVGRDLKTYLPEDKWLELQQGIDAACVSDYRALAAAAPRLVMGYTQLEMTGDTLESDFNLLLETNNAALTAPLSNLQGDLPQYTLDASDKIFALGIGLNMNNAPGAAASFKTLMSQQAFGCPSLLGLQQQVSVFDLAALAPLQQAAGITGVGMALFDLQTGGVGTMPTAVDGLVTISATQPETVVQTVSGLAAAMLGMTIDIPNDGTVVDLNLPTGFAVKAAIKGQQFALFSGAKAEQVVADLENQTGSQTGLLSMAMDYRQYGNLLTSVSAGQDCTMQYTIQDMFSRMSMASSGVVAVNEAGIYMQARAQQQLSPQQVLTLPGSYQADYLDENCQWIPAGLEIINDNGSGIYTEKDTAAGCVVFESRYEWAQEGFRVNFEGGSASRESCEQDLVANEEQEAFSCLVMNVTESGFQCLYDGEGSPYLYRYTRQ